MTNSAILNRITGYYLGSNRFNGLPVSSLTHDLDTSYREISPYLVKLVKQRVVSILYGDTHPNPYVRALPDESIEKQLAKLIPQHLERACIYPLPNHLKRVVDQKLFSSRPFTLKMALGEPQYKFEYFDPAVLNHYLQKHGCRINYDVQSTLLLPGASIKFTRAAFGPTYGIQFTSLLSANLEQLSLLPAQEQQYWHSMSLPGPCTVHPDVVHTLIDGKFRDRICIFEALLEEMYAVNGLCSEMNLPVLHRIYHEPHRALKNLGFMPSPSLESFHQFFLQFQIFLLQNLNPAFLTSIDKPPFRPMRSRQRRTLDRPSKTALEHLNNWLSDTFSLPHEDSLIRLSNLIKKTRHNLYDRLFYSSSAVADHSLLHLQRKLVWYAYHAIKAIRICFERFLGKLYSPLHPLVREDKVWVI